MQQSSVCVQISHIDYALARPGPLDDTTAFPLVPIVRIFGFSSVGLPACVHVHQVYPYFYVEYSGVLNPKSVNRYVRKLTMSLNYAIAVSLKRDPLAPKSRFIRSIFLVKGIPFYGFHSSYASFLKIHVIDPAFINRVVAILQSGSVMSTRFRIFESHIGFILQFLSDFGLYGCGWLDLGHVFQRGMPNESNSRDQSAPLFPSSPHFRQSRMALELDVVAQQILNRHELTARNLHHKLQITTVPQLHQALVLSVRELWDDERKRRTDRGLDPTPVVPVDPSDSSRFPRAEWAAEAQWWEQIRARIEREREQFTEAMPSGQWDNIMSTFESVEGLWDTSSPLGEQDNLNEIDGMELDVDVDEAILSDQAMIMLEEQEEHERDLLENNDENEEDDDVHESYDDLDDLDDSDGSRSDQSSQSLASNDDDVQIPRSSDKLHRSSHSEDYVAFEPESPTRKRVDLNRTSLLSSQRTRDGSFPSASVQHRTVPRLSITPAKPIAPASDRTRTKSTTQHRFQLKPSSNCYSYVHVPPSFSSLLGSSEEYEIPSKIYQTAYYSNGEDIPEMAREYGGLVYRLQGEDRFRNLAPWGSQACDDDGEDVFSEHSPSGHDPDAWEYAAAPPSVRAVKRWLNSHPSVSPSHQTLWSTSQIQNSTLANKYGVKNSIPPGIRERPDMTIFSLEIFAPSRGQLSPDPAVDEIRLVFYSFQKNDSEAPLSGIVVIQSLQHYLKGLRTVVSGSADELDLINKVADIVVELDPDIIVGWDVEGSSWGYLNLRASHYNLDLTDIIARAPMQRAASVEQWEKRTNSTLKVVGRHVLNVWRVMRKELTLNIYTFENVVFQVLQRRVPEYPFSTLTRWLQSPIPAQISAAVRYFADRALINLLLLNAVEVVTKTAEFARVFGVDFYSVLTRGSQFKVESFMFRIAKPESFVLLSPSKIDVGKQNAAECMPLIMEPQAAFYTSPLVVLDFQSLYPSVMIAYNYCYSTFLGRIQPFQGRYKFGVTDHAASGTLLEKLKDHINVAPNGMMYVKPQVRKGLLGRMLTEILDTRVMVKQAMKGIKDDRALRRVLNARQLGLKYIANVTYGYTGATFSGRMPAVEIADSIVQTGREILEEAILTINSTTQWGAEVSSTMRSEHIHMFDAQVVYGDTDSVFVYLRGKTKEQAFRIGQEIADKITSMNPSPIKLKFEKVYLPCVLLAKKRYVGFQYESIDEHEPVFDAKGIETVRRDGVPAQQKMTENCLKILFRSKDLSKVKAYCYENWTRLLENRISVQDFIFAKEVRIGTYSEKVPPPPGVAVVARRTALDPHYEAQYGERVRYVIIRGSRTKLVDRARDPLEVLNDSNLSLDAHYYISRVLIPPLDRIFSLMGADVRQWFDDMARPILLDPSSPSKKGNEADVLDVVNNINGHLVASVCAVCAAPALEGLCYDCYISRDSTMADMLNKINVDERRLIDTHKVCASCTGIQVADPIECVSLDCPWFYARRKAVNRTEVSSMLGNMTDALEFDYSSSELSTSSESETFHCEFWESGDVTGESTEGSESS